MEVGHVMLLEGKIFFRFSFSLEIQAEKSGSGFLKVFTRDISLYLLNIFATAAPK